MARMSRSEAVPLSRSRLGAVLVLLTTTLVAPGALQAAPVDEVLQLVPADAGFCLVIRDLREHGHRLAESPFAKQFQDSLLGKSLQHAPEFRRLAELEKQLQTHLQTSLAEVRDEVLGDAIVVAYWPANEKQPERMLFLTKARKPDLLERISGRLLQFQKNASEVESVKYKDQSYHRIKEKIGKVSYQFVHAGLLALTEDEAMLRQVIDAQTAPAKDHHIAKQLRDLGVADAFATFWLNPRAFDGLLKAQAQVAAEPEASFLRNLLKYWEQTRAVALALRVDQELELRLVLQVNTAGLPDAAQRFLRTAGEPSRMWSKFPERTILAVAGRFDFTALLDMLSEFAPQEERKKSVADLERACSSLLGLDLRREVLPNLGPDWGFYVTAPPAGQAVWFPHIVVAVETRPKPEQKPLGPALFEALRTLAGIYTLGQADQTNPTTLKTEMLDKVQVVSLVNEKLFPAGLQPAFAFKSSCLVFASSPGAIRTFDSSPLQPVPNKQGRLLLARLSLKEAVLYLKQKEWRKGLVVTLARNHQSTTGEIDAHLDGLISILELFDQVDLLHQSKPGELQLTLLFKPVKPLRKE